MIGKSSPYTCETCTKFPCNPLLKEKFIQGMFACFTSLVGCASHSGFRTDTAKLDELQAWRIRRMNGMKKQDVWMAWNEETDLIDELRR